MVETTLDTEFLAVSEEKNYFSTLDAKDLLFFKRGDGWLMTRQRFVLHEDVDERQEYLTHTVHPTYYPAS